MKNVLVLGAGTAGTMIVNRLRGRLAKSEWTITVVDQDDIHHYQPGFLFIPFGTYTPEQVTRRGEVLAVERAKLLTNLCDQFE